MAAYLSIATMKATYSNNNGSVRIRVSQKGCKRLTWHPGLEYTKLNIKAVQALCRRIEIDILADNFDSTFEKYSLVTEITTIPPTILSYWLEWLEYQRDKISPTTYASELNTVTKLLEKYTRLTIIEAAILLKEAPTHYSLRTCTNCWKWLKACFNWHINNGRLKDNPFSLIPKHFKSNIKKNDIGVFSESQRQIIINEFDSTYPWYCNFVKFLFATGCRPEEAIALTWKDITSDCVSINKAYTRRILKETKTKQNRKIPINKNINGILQSQFWSERNLMTPKSDDLVFPSFERKYIDCSNFGTRVWKPLINSLVLDNKLPEYLSLYHCRHTFVSECLNAKIPIQQVAKWVGNSPEVIWRHYAGCSDGYVIPE